MSDFFKKIVISLADSADESLENGKQNVSGGINKMFGKRKSIQFNSPTDVLNYMLSEVTKGNCQHQRLSPLDDFSVILKWIQINHKGNRYYMVKSSFEDGSIAIAVFFADDDQVYIGGNDPKICFTSQLMPKDINDLFGSNNIYMQTFK